MKNIHLLVFISIILFTLSSCIQNETNNSEDLHHALQKIDDLESQLNNVHIPGWGETMRGSVQIHHSNLYFAGEAENWELAEHMLEEIEESFEKLEKWYPEDERTAAIPIIESAMNNLAEVIKQETLHAFKNSYSELTNACNACQQATGEGIYMIQIPTNPGLTNMSFEK